MSGRVVVIDVGDLLTFQTAARFVLDELDRRSTLRPIGSRHREEIREPAAIGRSRDAKAGRCAGDLVLLELLVERLGLRCAVDHHRDGAIALLALVLLDCRRHLVLVVELIVIDLVTLDAALRVDKAHIILLRRANHDADDLRRPGAIALRADHYLLLLSKCSSG